MKTRTSLGWVLGIALAGGAVGSGFAQNDLNSSQTAVSSEKTGAAAPSQAAPATPGSAGGTSLSSNRYLSPWYYEVERLTQAGVGEAEVLSYITNVAGTFNLSADQVISLKNLGASPQVINAMMLHDRELISGRRPMPVSAPPPLPPSVQAALAASLHRTEQASAPAATPASPAPASSGSIVAPDDESGAGGTWVWVEPDDVPDQPASAGPVRVPYAVKLNDPIVVLRLPTFALPCW